MKMLKQSALFLSFALAFAACDNGSRGTEAETGEAQQVVEVAEATSFAIEPSSSELTWRGRKPGGEHYGTIGVEGGVIQLQENAVVGGSIDINLNDIDVQDLEGEDEQKLAGHLKSPDFFAAEQYPTAKFIITAVEPYGNGEGITNPGNESSALKSQTGGEKKVDTKYVLENPTHKVTGNLTLRDTTLSITIPAEIQVNDNQLTAKSKFLIDRTKWNVKYGDETDPVNKAKDKFIYNDVNVGFDIVASKR